MAAHPETLLEMSMGSIYTYGLTDLVKKQEHSDQYTQYLRNGAARRDARKQANESGKEAAVRLMTGILNFHTRLYQYEA
jgi:hypothetical protein